MVVGLARPLDLRHSRRRHIPVVTQCRIDECPCLLPVDRRQNGCPLPRITMGAMHDRTCILLGGVMSVMFGTWAMIRYDCHDHFLD